MLIGLTIMMMVLGSKDGLFGSISGFDLFVGTVGGVLMLLFVLQTLATGRRLSKMDMRPDRTDRAAKLPTAFMADGIR